MIWRSHDIDEINKLINNPEIKENSNIDHEIDVSDLMGYIWICGKGFLFVFIDIGDGVYECHVGATRAQRGKQAIIMGLESLRYMRENTSCDKVVGIVPCSNRAAIQYGKLLGFSIVGAGNYNIGGEIMECRIMERGVR